MAAAIHIAAFFARLEDLLAQIAGQLVRLH
jgi:hypothetical protein